MQSSILKTAVALFSSAFIASFASGDEAKRDHSSGKNAAHVVLSPTSGNDVRGSITFLEKKDGVHVVGRITNLSPGLHGFHVHENGDCSAPDASSAGGHYNPTGAPHGAPEFQEQHIGDMGNIVADKTGEARVDMLVEHLKLKGKNSIIGKAVIVHGGTDDLVSQPSGAAGPRVACGVIEKEEREG